MLTCPAFAGQGNLYTPSELFGSKLANRLEKGAGDSPVLAMFLSRPTEENDWYRCSVSPIRFAQPSNVPVGEGRHGGTGSQDGGTTTKKSCIVSQANDTPGLSP